MAEDAGLRNIAAHCLNAFLISLVLSLAMEKLARRFGFVDVPTSRKKHEGSIPLVGLAVFLAFSASSLLVSQRPPGVVGLFVALTMIVLIGLVDDKMDLRAPYKLLAQVISVAVIAWSGDLLIVSAGNLDHGQPLMLGQWAFPVTIFAVVGMINAINMIDGLDGLAGGISLTSLIWFAAAAQLLGRFDEFLVILVLACSVLGFLVLNIRNPWRLRAAVFLGDSGSMMLGLALAFVAVSLSQHSEFALSPIAVLWICGLPIIDTLSLIVRRLAAGHNPMASDRQHLHYLMLDSGFTVSQTVVLLIGINIVLGAIGVVGWHLEVPDRILLLGLMAPISLHTWFVGYGRKHQPGIAHLSHEKAARRPARSRRAATRHQL
jgi:UDP-GlcNAc:undecaprenyl-phosphate GlcNAc-1-phosphate transferase